MGNAALLTENMFDTALVSASSSEVLMPPNTLQTPHVSERWRSTNNEAYIVIDKGDTTAADTVMVRGLTATSRAIVRLRLSATDPTALAGDVLNTPYFLSGTIDDGGTGVVNFDVNYGGFVYLFPTPQPWRYMRFDILDDAGPGYVEAGAVCIGVRTQFTYNFSAGASVGWNDRSIKSTTAGGLTLTWNDNAYRSVSLNFGTVTNDQRYGMIEQLDRVNGLHSNVLLILDPNSTNLPRDSIWGLVKDMTPVTQPQVIRLFGKTFDIDERL
jgi:hypothetical protein